MGGARLSRILIVVLFGVLAVGLLAYVFHQRPEPAPQAVAQPPASQPIPLIAVSQTPAPTPLAAVASTPATAPAPGNPQLAMNDSPSAVDPAPATPAASGNPIGDAKARIDADDLLGGRAILNDALRAGALSATDTAAAKALIGQANQIMLFSDRRLAGDPYTSSFLVPSGAALERIAAHHGVTAALLCRINNLADPRKLRAGSSIKLIEGPFHAVVTKSTFTMDIYLGAPGEKGSVYVASFPVGLGRDDSTPTGTWMVQPGKKVHDPIYYSPRGAGVVAADDAKNPLGKYWIGLVGTDGHAVGQQSYGIHGTNDEGSIGKQASLGCIRMHNADVEQVFDLLVDGKSTVIVRN